MHLVVLMLAALLPVLLASAVAMVRTAASYRETSEQRLVDTASALARSVEGELRNRGEILQTLAVTDPDEPALRDARRGWLKRWGQKMGGEVSEAEQALSNQEAGEGALSVLRQTIEAARRQDEPVVSNLFRASDSMGAPQVVIGAQGRVDGFAPPSTMVMRVPPQSLVGRLAQPASGPAPLAAVTDGTGLVVARTKDPERWIGKPVPDWATLQALGTDRGFFEARTIEGRPIAFGFQRLSGTPGWVVVVGEPLNVFNARWQPPLIAMVGGTLAALVLGLVAVGWLSHRILEPIGGLARRARDIVDGGDAPSLGKVPKSSIDEFETLRASLEEADEALRQRALAEQASAERVRASEIRWRTLVESGALIHWRATPDGALTAADGWTGLTDRPEAEALGHGWLAQVHPEDRPALKAGTGSAIADGRALDHEFRLRFASGQWRWVRLRGAPLRDVAGAVREWVGVLEDIDVRRRAQARITHMAHHDELTGLPNRVQLRERLEQTLARCAEGGRAAVLGVDLDRFKDVNDSLGHGIGDTLLREVTGRLQALLREGDFIARLGGDEFAVIQEQVDERAQAVSLARRIVDALSAPFLVDGHHVVIGASVGIVPLDADAPGGAEGVEDVLRRADLALYRAKQQGRGRHAMFEPALDERMQRRRVLELALREALAQGRFELHYQPIVDLRTRRVASVEALIRWTLPGRGFVPPDEFIPLAEEIGLIVPIGQWVLQRAADDMVELGRPQLRVAVNVSAGQLQDRTLIESVDAVLRRTSLPVAQLEVEVSERLLMQEGSIALDVLRELRAMGVTVTMDDFGTGQTALNHLGLVPFDKVKIDRSFTQGLGRREDATAIVGAVLGLGARLGMVTVAEGVETVAQRELLADLGCAQVQGWLYAKAVPASELVATIDRLDAQLSAARA